MKIAEDRKYNTFNQGSDARLSVVVAVILRSTGTNTPSSTPRINDPVRIEIKQCHRFVLVTTAAKSVEDTASIIVCGRQTGGAILVQRWQQY